MKTITLHFDENIVISNNNIDAFPTYGGIYIAFTNFSFLSESGWKVEFKLQPSKDIRVFPTIKNDYLYIGQADNIRNRMGQHRNAEDIQNSKSIIPVNYCFCPIPDKKYRSAIEAILIHHCKPSLNIQYNTLENYDADSAFRRNGYDQIRVVLEDKKHFNPNMFGPLK